LISQVTISLIGAIITSVVLYVMLAKSEPAIHNIDMYDGEAQKEYTKRLKVYEEFNNFWSSIPVTWNDHHVPQKKFMFDFMLKLIVSCWDDFSYAEVLIIKSKAIDYLECSEDELADTIEEWREVLPKFSVNEEERRIEASDIVQLFEDLIHCEDVCTEYTFNEGVSMMPFFISYPPEFAFQLLKHMGYEKGMHPKT